MKIFKYVIPITSKFELSLPTGAQILQFTNQHEIPTLWVLLDPDKTEETYRTFHIFGTGHEILNSNLKYIGTALFDGGSLVWHLFEEPNL